MGVAVLRHTSVDSWWAHNQHEQSSGSGPVKAHSALMYVILHSVARESSTYSAAGMGFSIFAASIAPPHGLLNFMNGLNIVFL